MDREALARRNQRLAAIRHRPSAKQRIRNGALRLIAKAPVALQRSKSNRLLIIRPDHLGDMLLTTPAIQAVKRGRPELSIHVLCGPWCAELLANYEEVDRVLTLPFPGFGRGGNGRVNPWKLALQSAAKLRRIGYDSAIIMRPDHWWGALVAKLAGIGQRIGYDQPGLAPFLTDARRLELEHVVEQNLRLAQMLTAIPPSESIGLDFPLQDDDRGFIDRQLEAWQIAWDEPVICIHPGSGAASKLWTSEKWAAVADTMSREFKAAVVLTGTAGEAAIVHDIVERMKSGAGIIAGATSVGQLAALYCRSLAVLGPDSGAMHIAAAVDAPTVTLFGPADPKEFAPWGDRRRHAVVASDIACRPCRILEWRDELENHPCVREITVEQVLGAVRGVLAGG